MLIGLCGTHGTGKSTILQGIRDRGYVVFDSQLSRAAQAALGWESLSKAQESSKNMWMLQDAILGAMYDRDVLAEQQNRCVLVERTPADAWAYTEMWCRRLNIDPTTDRRAQRYKAQCRELAKRYVRFLIVPMHNEIAFVQEPNRADLESREYVHHAIENFLIDGGLPASTLKFVNKDERICEVEAWMKAGEAKMTCFAL